MSSRDDPTDEELLHLVRNFRVCWEVWPEHMVVAGQKRQVGFTLELNGTHAPDMEHPEPSCHHCRRVFLALGSIARHILPKDRRPSMYEIQPYDQAIHYTPLRHNRNDVVLAIKILHREGLERPVDACEVHCLQEMEARLGELGACKGRWKPPSEVHSP